MLAMKKALIFALLTLVAGTQVDGFAGSSQHFSPFSKNIIAKPKRHALAAPQLHKTGSLGASLPGTEVMAEVPVAQESQQNVAKEILAGIVVTLATVPTSISYSLVVGVSPVIGIWNSAICGLFAALIGGAPGVIVGSAGVTALPMASLHSSLGPAYMSASLLLASAMEAIFGILRLSKFADVITTPVIAGFLNALAIFIGKSQVKVFKDAGHWLTGSPLTSSLSLAALTASLIFSLVPYRSIIKVPPQLIAITVSTLLAQFLHLPVKLLGEQAGKGALVGGLSALPKINGLPNVPFNLHTLQLIGSTAVGVALVCIVETLLAQRIKPDQSKDNSDRAMVGLGVGSLLSALIGGFGGCGLIPNTLLNIGSGGRGNLSSLTYAITMALSVIFCSKVLTAIPMAVLAGLMMTVAYNTMEWNESYHFLKETFHSTQAFLDSLAMVVTTFLSFAVDMGLGILVGTLIANLQRIYQSITRKTASK